MLNGGGKYKHDSFEGYRVDEDYVFVWMCVHFDLFLLLLGMWHLINTLVPANEISLCHLSSTLHLARYFTLLLFALVFCLFVCLNIFVRSINVDLFNLITFCGYFVFFSSFSLYMIWTMFANFVRSVFVYLFSKIFLCVFSGFDLIWFKFFCLFFVVSHTIFLLFLSLATAKRSKAIQVYKFCNCECCFRCCSCSSLRLALVNAHTFSKSQRHSLA